MLLRKPPQTSWPRFALGMFVPHSVVTMITDTVHRPDRRLDESLALQAEHASHVGHRSYGYELAVTHLVERGLPELEVRGGSMPEASLQRCGSTLLEQLDRDRPLTILHVGNFVGVSLSWFADLARSWNRESRVVGVDPNVTHRGIETPQEHVISVLETFGLQSHVLLVTGYTLAKNPSDLDLDDPGGRFARDHSSENALSNLSGLCGGRFDVAVMDGNHEPDYLRSELAHVQRLLRPGGLLVLDDVFDWRSLRIIARELDESPRTAPLARDGRLGIWQLDPPCS